MQNDIKPSVPANETPVAAALPKSEPTPQSPVAQQPEVQAPAVETPVPDAPTAQKQPKKSTAPVLPILIAVVVFLGLSACVYAIYRGL